MASQGVHIVKVRSIPRVAQADASLIHSKGLLTGVKNAWRRMVVQFSH